MARRREPHAAVGIEDLRREVGAEEVGEVGRRRRQLKLGAVVRGEEGLELRLEMVKRSGNSDLGGL